MFSISEKETKQNAIRMASLEDCDSDIGEFPTSNCYYYYYENITISAQPSSLSCIQ